MKNKKFLFSLFLLAVILFSVKTGAKAAPTDEILTYDIQAYVNDTGTVDVTYTISWKVLDDSIGRVEWLNIGIPNSHVLYKYPVTDNIDYLSYSSSGGNFIQVYFNDSYGEDEVIDFSFVVEMDYMYTMNEREDGYTVYHFTPGWFDDINTDSLTIRWDATNVYSISPSAILNDGYYTWETSLGGGEYYSIEVTYPNDTYAFDTGYDSSKDYNDTGYSSSGNDYSTAGGIVGLLSALISIPFMLISSILPIAVPVIIIKTIVGRYKNGSGFSSGETTKITRTLIEYYPVCQGCGAARNEGEKFCSYCGRSLVKSEEKITEEKVAENQKDILNYKTAGTYHYSSNPNTFVIVNVTKVPRPASSSHTSSGRGSSGGHSCACACASHCACACACACAGGGRAGCSNKDFYNTNLKLKFLQTRKKK